MPETRKEARNCHNCGLEDFDACDVKENPIHRPALEKDEVPCSACARNPEIIGNRFDFYDEQWTREFTTKKGVGKCFIEDPDPHEVSLLKLLHRTVNGEEVRV